MHFNVELLSTLKIFNDEFSNVEISDDTFSTLNFFDVENFCNVLPFSRVRQASEGHLTASPGQSSNERLESRARARPA